MPTLPSGPSHVFPHHITPHQAEKEQQENRKHFHQRTIKVARSTVKVGILSLFHLSLPKLYCFTFSLLKEALGITLLHLLKKKKNAGCNCCRQGSAWAASSFSLWDKICVIQGLLFWLHPLNIRHKFASTTTLTLRSPGLQQTMRNIKWEEGIGEILEAYSELSFQLHCKTCTTHWELIFPDRGNKPFPSLPFWQAEVKMAPQLSYKSYFSMG